MTPPLHLRVFLSSPGDVSGDRFVAARVLDDLTKGHEYNGRVFVDSFAYDDPRKPVPLPLNQDPQQGVIKYGRRPADCDFCLAFLWRRFGTPLPPSEVRPGGGRYLSGTEYEVETAMAAGRDVFLYVRQSSPPSSQATGEADDAEEQYARVREFLDRFENRDRSIEGSTQRYEDSADLARLLRGRLAGVLRHLLDAHERRWRNRWRVGGLAGLVILGLCAATGATFYQRLPSVSLSRACEAIDLPTHARVILRLTYTVSNYKASDHILLTRLADSPGGFERAGPSADTDGDRGDNHSVKIDTSNHPIWALVRMEIRDRATDKLVAASEPKQREACPK